MPKETDRDKLDLLHRIFADPASNVPEISETARTGGVRRDEGLRNLIAGELPLSEKLALLKEAIVDYLDSEGLPNRILEKGDAEMGLDAAMIYEFRFSVSSVPLYVKVELTDPDPTDPQATIISIKHDDRGGR